MYIWAETERYDDMVVNEDHAISRNIPKMPISQSPDLLGLKEQKHRESHAQIRLCIKNKLSHSDFGVVCKTTESAIREWDPLHLLCIWEGEDHWDYFKVTGLGRSWTCIWVPTGHWWRGYRDNPALMSWQLPPEPRVVGPNLGLHCDVQMSQVESCPQENTMCTGP